MIDIHTHLYFPQYDVDRDEVLRRAFETGLERMICVGTEPEDWPKALGVSRRDERISVALGVHPHYFNQHGTGNLKRIITVLKEFTERDRDKVVAIGECGLDYFSHTETPISDEQKQWQREGFLAQLALAQELDLPMIIHCRDAYEELLRILKEHGEETRFVLHCYMGDVVVTQHFLELPNVYFSFTGNITYPVKKVLVGTEHDLHETVRTVPLERMLTETDCPFLAPHPHRGTRNEPAYVALIVQKAAELKGVSGEMLSEAVARNAETIFGKKR
jgi:TatD DNase family protein